MDDLFTDPMHRAVMEAMQAIVDATPDNGEGSRFDYRSDFAWHVLNEYRLTFEEFGLKRLQQEHYWEDEAQTDAATMSAEDVRSDLICEALRAMSLWVQKDLD